MNLLALVESPGHVCCRYRIRSFASFLSDAGWSVTYSGFDRGPLLRPYQLRRARHFDAVLLQRKLLPGWQLRTLRYYSKRLVFDFDDAVKFRDSYDERGHESGRRSRRFAQTVRMVDTVVAGNDFLADCALRDGADAERVHVIPTCVDPQQYPIARQDARGDHFDLVWIGSASTLKGLEQSRPIWERLARAIPQLRLRVICDQFPTSFPIPVIPIAWDEQSDAREIARGHVGVSWLPNDLWSRGKCGLKVLQYQAAGLPVVANPVGAHCEMVRDGETGFLATTPDEWVDAIVLLATDARRRQQMGLSARQHVEADYSVTAWGETFVSSMTGISGPAVAASWKIDRSVPTHVGAGIEPLARETSMFENLYQIGDR